MWNQISFSESQHSLLPITLNLSMIFHQQIRCEKIPFGIWLETFIIFLILWTYLLFLFLFINTFHYCHTQQIFDILSPSSILENISVLACFAVFLAYDKILFILKFVYSCLSFQSSCEVGFYVVAAYVIINQVFVLGSLSSSLYGQVDRPIRMMNEIFCKFLLASFADFWSLL